MATDMKTRKSQARRVGLLYLLMGLPAPFDLIYLTKHFVVPGDPAATARNIEAQAFLYRLCTLAGVVSSVGFLLLVWQLYQLFQDVDRKTGRIMVILVVPSVAIGLIATAVAYAPLVLLGDGDTFAAFTRPQLEALAYAALRFRSAVMHIDEVFWGLWLFPFGVLVMKSRFIPRVIGALLIIGCVGYVVVSLTAMLFPPYLRVVDSIAMPFYGIGEVSVMLWLITVGARNTSGADNTLSAPLGASPA
jgi:hypothetical protein